MTSNSDSLKAEMAPIKKVGRFILYRELGRGAIGTVYFGYDPLIERDVAIKIFHNPPSLQDKKQQDQLFMNEARTAGRLSHPNIITIFDAANEGDEHFIAMEYLQGQDLSQFLTENKPLSYLTLAEILQKIAEGLDYAHSEGVIHRDIKPANIFIQENMHAKLVDFGIAHAIKHKSNKLNTTAKSKEHTATIFKNNVFIGTPNYMSPEQTQSKQISKLTDVYSLGAVMYEMLVRQKPFESPDLDTLINKIIHKKIKAPHEINAQIPVALSRIVMKAMEKKPEKRYQSALEMARELRRFVLITKRSQKQSNLSQENEGMNSSYRRLFWLGCVAIIIAAFVALNSWLAK